MAYKMKLHNDTKLFKQAIQATSQHKGLLEIYVEKDYWVTFVLHIIFHSELRDSVVFKGGTALSPMCQHSCPLKKEEKGG